MRPYRRERVASVVHEIVSEVIARRLNDPRIAPLTTVSRVEINPDLSVGTIYLTVMGDAAVEKQTLYAIRHAGGFIQRVVAGEINLRQCPELRFQIDEKAKKVKAMMRLLDENRRAREAKEGAAASAIDPAAEGAVSVDAKGSENQRQEDDQE